MNASVVTDTRPAVAAPRRARYVGLAALGLVLAAAAPLVILITTLVSGLSLEGEAAFLIILAVVPLIAAALVWRFGMWARIVALVVSVLAGLAAFWMVFGLAYPASFADFVPGVLLPLGVLLGIIGSIAALVANRRGRDTTEPAAAERPLMLTALAIVGLAIVASAVLSFTSRQSVDAAAAEGALDATMRDFSFTEGTYQVAAGQPSSILVRNTDPVAHTFTIPALGIDQTVLPGSEALVEVTADAGTYTLYCVPHSNTDEPDPAQAGMAATFIAE